MKINLELWNEHRRTAENWLSYLKLARGESHQPRFGEKQQRDLLVWKDRASKLYAIRAQARGRNHEGFKGTLALKDFETYRIQAVLPEGVGILS